MLPAAALDASASRPRPGILTPSSDGSLNRRRGSISPDERNGKPTLAAAAAMEHLLEASITVKPHPPDIQAQPRSLSPLMLLPREHLPLSSLDFSSLPNGFPRTRFVQSHIKILDLESRLGCHPAVVIARNDSQGISFALERQEDGLYVMCKLGSWVDLRKLSRFATALCRSRLAPPVASCNQGQQQGEDAEEPITTPYLHGEQKKKRAAIEAIQNLVRKKSKSNTTVSVNVNNSRGSDGSVLDSQSETLQLPTPETRSDEMDACGRLLPATDAVSATNHQKNEVPPSSQESAESIFNNIQAQYFDALYKSMGSLAYFAKGPLSRARSTFHLDLESNLDMQDLIDFLKGLILTTVQIDKKYRETIPEVVSKMKPFEDSSDDGSKKRRKPRKMKLGKNALYPLEDENVRKWWSANKPEPTGDSMAISPSQIKSHVSLLRTRETQLQMILILEILALEPLGNACEAAGSSLPTLPGAEPQAVLETSITPPVKKRNKHNLPVLVDVHADRLTIWQSTASDEQLLLGDTQPSQVSADGRSQKKASSEPLRDFCVDIIVPFFSARLPELCDGINRKLGGPVIVTPIQSKSTRRSSGKREQQRPGAAATKRPFPPSDRRTLQRALSTEQMYRRSVSRGPGNAIALMRSATSTNLCGVKREGSEPLSLKDLPRRDSLSLLGRPRQSSSSLTHSNGTKSSLQDTKADKKALVEAELKDAISALRKPNRGVVGIAMAEADEVKAAASQSAKKTRRTARSTLAPSIQVKATPANNRFKDALPIKLESISTGRSQSNSEDLIPPSSIGHMVPSTEHRHGHRDALADSTSLAMDCLAETPVRASTQHSFIKRPPRDDETSPTRHTSSRGAHEDQEIMATPIKKSISKLRFAEMPVGGHAARSEKVSIYERLGWDDEFDDL
ncbi:hypothetical protein E4U17_002309 [Claviceps sp. LM77 group G4]|nr:hypothetical protein E4U17_002309 [Claviceps sp. LM77 group G4]KAG6083542.1 hypothetical protein E4U16_003951 [Claviceps sp. LM84 group G4]